jgi:hypothetical protein
MGIELPSTLAFDYPTANALAAHVLSRLQPQSKAAVLAPGRRSPAAGDLHGGPQPILVTAMSTRFAKVGAAYLGVSVWVCLWWW